MPAPVKTFVEVAAEFDKPGPPQFHYPALVNRNHIVYVMPWNKRSEEGSLLFLHDPGYSLRQLVVHNTFDEMKALLED